MQISKRSTYFFQISDFNYSSAKSDLHNGSLSTTLRRLDGVSEEGLIPSGALVLAVQARSGRLVVRSAPEEALGLSETEDDRA